MLDCVRLLCIFSGIFLEFLGISSSTIWRSLRGCWFSVCKIKSIHQSRLCLLELQLRLCLLMSTIFPS
ncbi:hypothetical protein LUU34_00299600 [Aix galericulata]|nr:hypothetical protein LUU34_00299600 [Aix galericulata]